MIIKQKNKLGAIAISQTILLIIAIFAFAFMIGSSIETVSASQPGECEEELANGTIINKPFGTDCGTEEGWYCANGRCVKNAEQQEDISNNPPLQNQEVSSAKNPVDPPKEKTGLTVTGAISTFGGVAGSAESIKSLFAKKVAEGAIEEGGTLAKGEITQHLTNEGLGDAVTGKAPKNSILTYFTKGYQGTYTYVDKASGQVFRGQEAISAAKAGGAEATPSATPKGFGAVAGNVFNTLAVAFGAAQLVIFAAKLLGAGERNMQGIKVAAYTSAAVAAAAAITLTYTIGATVATTSLLAGGPPGWLVAAVVVVATMTYMAFSYQDFSQEIFTYQPQVWQPQDGGENCEMCNDFRYGCSEYQCHSLGNSCDIINEGTEDEKCIWVNEKDILPPELRPLESALKSEDYKYIDSTAVLPGERGAKVVYKPNNNGCILPFTSVSFGVESNEPAECMIDVTRRNNLSDMASYMAQGPVSVYNHTLEIPASGMPSQEALDGVGWELETSNNYTFFIRCKDTNGNPTTANFLIEFCVDDGPDTQAPIIEGTNYLQESFVGYNQSEVPLEVFTNEPADCRWDFQDLDYDVMNNEMEDCSKDLQDYYIVNTFTYGCASTLTGIREGQDNNFYIKCKDKPWLEGVTGAIGKRFANKDPYILNLKGTYPLQIDEVTINGKETGTTIIDSTNTVKTTLKVKTSAGANEGRSKCQYGIDGNFYDFYNNGDFNFLYENVQDFFLPQGFYNYEVKCIDEAGNSAQDSINFTIEIDEVAPTVTRIYYEEGFLKLITNEEGTCIFSTDTCNYAFEDGIKMNDVDGYNHFVEWNTEVDLFIKCKDLFGNMPIPQNECSIVARAYE